MFDATSRTDAAAPAARAIPSRHFEDTLSLAIDAIVGSRNSAEAFGSAHADGDRRGCVGGRHGALICDAHRDAAGCAAPCAAEAAFAAGSARTTLGNLRSPVAGFKLALLSCSTVAPISGAGTGEFRSVEGDG